MTTWRTVRVFISSTFRDMHAERDHLVKAVFPALRERLAPFRVHLLDIDLRWGVTREQAENDRVLDVCLRLIDECRPFFIGLLGERYGAVVERISAESASRYGLLRAYQRKSITEFEILYGVLHNDAMRGHAFFYFRDPAALEQVPAEVRTTVYIETDQELVRKLADLKGRIRQSGYPVMDGYSARWDPQAWNRPSRSPGRLVDLGAFGERLQADLWEAIVAELGLMDDVSAPVTGGPAFPGEEDDEHRRFAEARLRVYVGREVLQEELLAHVDGNTTKPLLLTGRSGSGKSAVLAHLAAALRRRPELVVISHFVGATPRSSAIRGMLWRLALELQANLGIAEEVPQETNDLVRFFRELLVKVPAERRVIVVIDAIDQLDPTERARELTWLPRTLPSHVKLLLSCIDEPGTDQPVLQRARHLGLIERAVPPLDDTERRQIVRDVPLLSAKMLDDDQIDRLLANPATTNPLFLLVALEELRAFGSYEQLNERIAALPSKGDTLTAMFAQVIERVEEDFDREAVRKILTLLACAWRGLSEEELQKLLARWDGAAGDHLFPVLRQVRSYLLSRGGLLDFYHRNLRRAVQARYLDTVEKQARTHDVLAAYFEEQDYFLESLDNQRERALAMPPTPRPVNQRKIDELPWQRLRVAELAGRYEDLEKLFSDLFFLEAAVEGGMVFDLVTRLAATTEALPQDRPKRRLLQLFERAIRADIHFLFRRPTALFQCLWNRCWWCV
jgi:hypothetical protein